MAPGDPTTPVAHPLDAGYLILVARELSDLSQRALASEMGSSQPSLATLEIGNRLPTIRTLLRVADAADSSSSSGFAGRSFRGPTRTRSRDSGSRYWAPSNRTSRTASPTTWSSASRSRGRDRGEGYTFAAAADTDFDMAALRGKGPRSAPAAGAGSAAASTGRGTRIGRGGAAGHERVLPPHPLVPAVRARKRRVHRRRHRASLLEAVLARHAHVLIGGHVPRIPRPADARNTDPGRTVQPMPSQPSEE